MNKRVVILNAVLFCLSLQAADTTEHDLLRICGNDGQKALTLALGGVPGGSEFPLVMRKLGKDKEAHKSETNEKPSFIITRYPSYNPNPPFIVFGQIQANSKSETGIISNLAIREFVSGLLVLQCRSISCNENNLYFVQNNFLDKFTDAELLKGRIGSDQEVRDLIFQKINKLIQGQDKKSGKERESKPYAGNAPIAKDAEKVHCMLMWLSLQGDSYNRHEMHGFNINFEKIDDSSKQGMQQVQEEIEYLLLEGSDKVVGAVGFDMAHVKEKVEVDYAQPLDIMIKQCIHQLSNVKPYSDNKQPYFLILDAKEALKVESKFGDPLRELEAQLFSQVLYSGDKCDEKKKDVTSRYVGLADKGNAKLTEKDVLAMLRAGMEIAGEKSEQIGHDV